jgi:hypothetical protein
MSKKKGRGIPSPAAKWIWDGSDRLGHHYYLEARRTFFVGRVESASLLITADANYQVWLNGCCVGHGPAKSADGTRSVDDHDLLPLVVPGENVLEILVLCMGLGTMTYCPGEAGLLFEIHLDSKVIGSDAKVQVRRSASHLRPTARRWVMPCMEDVDASVPAKAWRSAQVVPKTVVLYPRRIPLPTRETVYPNRLAAVDSVKLPNFSVTYRIKPALVSAREVRRWNHFSTPATFRVPIISPKAQTLVFTPTLGHVTWSFRGKQLFESSGWQFTVKPGQVKIKLRKGRNELVGRHDRTNHFEDVHLAGFVEAGVEVGAMQVERDDGKKSQVKPLLFANAHDLAVGAVVESGAPVRRTIWDLGYVRNGWISFQARGKKGSAVMLAFFEAMENGGDRRIQWAEGCNNALTYRLHDGWQQFESFFPYGVRYIAAHEIGGPVDVRDLHLLKASCAHKPQGDFQTDDTLLNGIYRISVQCIESGTDDTFTDCPTFEQVNWNFDNRLASGADFWTTANLEIIRNSILLFAEDPEHPGLVASQTPSTWSLRIPLWSFNWIMWCWDYYWHTGDLVFVRKVFPRIKAGVKEALGMIGRKGLMEFPGAWHFVEWARHRDDDHAINATEQAALLKVLDIAGKLAAALGQPAEFAPAHAKLARAINRHLWNPAKKCYVDSIHEDGKPSTVSSQPTNAIMAIYGVADEEWSRKLVRSFVAGKSPLLPLGSPYGIYYILELMDRYGYGDEIIESVRKRWGDMVLDGDGTTWEFFSEFGHGSWPTRSRCHPFSAYVVKYLVKYILGIEVLAPGFASVRVSPHPPRTMKSATGTVPTPHGPLHVSWKRKGSKLDLKVDAPSGIKVVRE